MENKNGQGIFYGVIGVATLVVAIIGATFAYFSATATTNYVNNIAGNTLNLTGNALSVSVTRVTFASATADSLDLVPATVAVDGTGAPTTAGVTSALTANCEKGGYTGCHVYEISASSESAVTSAQIKLATLTTTNSTNTSDWKYIIYSGSTSSATSIISHGSMNLPSAVDMHAGAALSSTPSVYYLMIYLQEDNDANDPQNDGSTNDATGSYSGTVELTAAGGHVTANFTA